jgi:hypothetical protein
VPEGETSGRNLDLFCRRHHRGKTFAWLACIRDDYGVDWTMPDAEHYRCLDDPLPTGRAAELDWIALDQLTALRPCPGVA